MIEYGDTYHLQVWNRLYPVTHPKKDWGGKVHDQHHIKREDLKKEVVIWLDNPETVSITISREEK